MRLRNGGRGGTGMRHYTTTTTATSNGNAFAFTSMSSSVVVLRGSRFHGVSVSRHNNNNKLNRNNTKNNNNTSIQKQQLQQHRRQQPQCYADNSVGRDGDGDDDGKDDDDDEYDDEPDIVLHEDSTGRTLPVGVQCIVPFNDEQYFVCYPMDDPVAFVRAPSSSKSNINTTPNNNNRKHKGNTKDEEYEDGDLEPIEDQDVIDKLFPNASAVLAETHLQLQNTPFVLTVADFSDTVLHEPDDTFDGGDGGDEDDGTTLGDDRDVEIVAEFMANGMCYFVVRPVEEVLIVAKAVGEAKTEFEVLSSNELERVSPVIEEYIDRERKEGAFI